MMKKIFLGMLLLLTGSAASMNAQALIGADDSPDPSAVLELRSGNQGLLLPQINLDNADNTGSLLTTPVAGMLVCNLTGSLPRGIYFWNEENAQWTVYVKFE
jgi:hypothetical protein